MAKERESTGGLRFTGEGEEGVYGRKLGSVLVWVLCKVGSRLSSRSPKCHASEK